MFLLKVNRVVRSGWRARPWRAVRQSARLVSRIPGTLIGVKQWGVIIFDVFVIMVGLRSMCIDVAW